MTELKLFFQQSEICASRQCNAVNEKNEVESISSEKKGILHLGKV